MKSRKLTPSEAGDALSAILHDDTVDGFAICDPEGSFTDGIDGAPWGLGESVEAAWHSFGYPSLNIEAYKKDGWKCKPRKLRRKLRA